MNHVPCNTKAFFQIVASFCFYGEQLSDKISPSGGKQLSLIALGFFFPSRFTLPGEVDIDNIPYEELSPPSEEPARNKKEKKINKRRELLKLVNFAK